MDRHTKPRHAHPLALGILVWLFAQLAVQAQVPSAEWTLEYEQARNQAEQDGMPMLLMFSSKWCPPCKTMTQDVLPKEKVRQEIQNYIAVYLDAEINKSQFQNYNVEIEPTFVVMDTGRSERDRMLGLVSQELFSARLRFWNRVFELESLLETAPTEAELWRRKGLLMASQMHLEQARDAFAQAVSITQGGVLDYMADLDFTNLIASRNNSLEQLESKLDTFKEKYPASSRVQDIVFVKSLIARKRGQEALFVRLLEKYKDKADSKAMFAEQASILFNHVQAQSQKMAPHPGSEPANVSGETVAANPTPGQ